MTALKDVIADPVSLARRLRVAIPEPIKLRKVVEGMAGGGEPPPPERISEIQARMTSFSRRGEVHLLTRRDFRIGCQVFLIGQEPPGRDPEVRRQVLQRVKSLKRRAPFFALLDAYLNSFRDDDDATQSLGSQLSFIARDWPWRPRDLWPQRFETFDLLDAEKAPKRIAEAVLAADTPPLHVLDQAGLGSTSRRKGGLAEAAFKIACRSIASRRGPSSLPLQQRLMAWAGDEAAPLAFPTSWPDYAAALFLPWTAQEPAAEHKSAILDAAIAYAGDPRTRGRDWRAVAPEARGVVIRWLTRASVEQFFDIVAETTARPDMWADRRRFWTAYLRADHISAAWVAFGSAGAFRARQAAQRNNDTGLSMFGRLASGGGRTPEHAALIMEIGDLIIVEWSHNGRWYAWPKGSKDRPQLFRHNSRNLPDYAPQELMGAPESGVHHHEGGWKATVAHLIYRHTGLRP